LAAGRGQPRQSHETNESKTEVEKGIKNNAKKYEYDLKRRLFRFRNEWMRDVFESINKATLQTYLEALLTGTRLSWLRNQRVHVLYRRGGRRSDTLTAQ